MPDAPPPASRPVRRRIDWQTVATVFAILLAVGLVLTETIALRDAGRRLRAQEAAERAQRRAARAADSLAARVPAGVPGAAVPPR